MYKSESLSNLMIVRRESFFYCRAIGEILLREEAPFKSIFSGFITILIIVNDDLQMYYKEVFIRPNYPLPQFNPRLPTKFLEIIPVILDFLYKKLCKFNGIVKKWKCLIFF